MLHALGGESVCIVVPFLFCCAISLGISVPGIVSVLLVIGCLSFFYKVHTAVVFHLLLALQLPLYDFSVGFAHR